MTDVHDFTMDMKIVKFNGNKDEWPRWSKKFMSVAKIKKFSHVIDGSVEVPAVRENMEEAQKLIKERLMKLHTVTFCIA